MRLLEVYQPFLFLAPVARRINVLYVLASFFVVAPTHKTIPLLNVGLKLAVEAPAKRQVRRGEVTEDPRNWLPTRHKEG
jgi:hypothetical protein